MHLEPPYRTRNLDVNELVVLVVCPLSFSVFPSRQPASDQQTRAALSNQQHSWRRRRPQCASHSRHAGSVAEAATSQGHRDWRAGGSLLRHPAAFSRSRRPPVRLGCAMREDFSRCNSKQCTKQRELFADGGVEGAQPLQSPRPGADGPAADRCLLAGLRDRQSNRRRIITGECGEDGKQTNGGAHPLKRRFIRDI